MKRGLGTPARQELCKQQNRPGFPKTPSSGATGPGPKCPDGKSVLLPRGSGARRRRRLCLASAAGMPVGENALQDRSDRTEPGSPSHRGLQRPTCAWKSALRTRGA